MGGLAGENIERLIISPIPRTSGSRGSFLFLIAGYLLEIYVPSAPYREWRRPGALKDAKNLFVPARDIFDVPELQALVGAGHRKSVQGLTSPTIRRREAKGR